MKKSYPKSSFARFSLLAVLMLAVMFLLSNASAFAQDDGSTPTPTEQPPTDPPPTDPPTPTEEPTLPPTETPTQEPTLPPTEPPTETPTQEPTLPPTETPSETPTEIPTEVPTEIPSETPTVEPTLTPSATPLYAPPSFASLTPLPFSTDPTTPLTLLFNVFHMTSGVVMSADTTGTLGTVEITTAAPVGDDTAGYVMAVTILYTPPAELPADFLGSDSFILTATFTPENPEEAPSVSSVTLSINLLTGVPTETPIPDPVTTPTKELIISYPPSLAEDVIQAMLLALNAVELERIPQIGSMRIFVPEYVTVENVQSLLTTSPGVMTTLSNTPIYAEEPSQMFITGTVPSAVNEPNYALHQWAIRNTTYGMYVGNDTPGVKGAWDITGNTFGSGVLIGLIDTGIDYANPDFSGRINGSGWDFVNDDNRPADDNGHGSAMAGIIAANRNNTSGFGTAPGAGGMVGIASSSSILPVKVCNSANSCEIFDVAQGIIYAVDKGAKIINLSMGTCQGESTTVRGAIEYALYRNVIVIASAGNGGGPDDPNDPDPDPECDENGGNAYSWPASQPGVISVAAHNELGETGTDDQGFNYNDRITVSAPGLGIWTASLYTNISTTGYSVQPGGTSHAAAHVTGLAALMWSRNIARTPQNVKEALICSANTNVPGYDPLESGAGYVQADKAVSWNSNSGDCRITIANDDIEDATFINKKTVYTQQIPIHSRSSTRQRSDPAIYPEPASVGDNSFVFDQCSTYPVQTLWYRFVPSESTYFTLSTLGSRAGGSTQVIDTMIAVFEGTPGSVSPDPTNPSALRPIACSNDTALPTTAYDSENAFMLVPLVANRTYYVMVATSDENGGTIGIPGREVAPYDDMLINFDLRRAVPNNTRYMATADRFSVYGNWVSVSQPSTVGATSNTVRQTFQIDATFAFAFKGTGFELRRLVGPGMGSMEIFVDGLPARINGFLDPDPNLRYLNNRAANNKVEGVFIEPQLASLPTQWHTVVIRPFIFSDAPAGPIAINTIQAFDQTEFNALTSLSVNFYSDAAARNVKQAINLGGELVNVPGTHGGTVHRLQQGESLTFKINANGFTIFRSLTTSASEMAITIDGVEVFGSPVNNQAAAVTHFVPFSVVGLANGVHNITITATLGDVDFDGMHTFNTASIGSAAASVVREMKASWAMTPTVLTPRSFYSPTGVWAHQTHNLGTRDKSAFVTSDQAATVDFYFHSTHFCIGYVQEPGNASFDVYIDNMTTPVTTVNTDGASQLAEWCSARPDKHWTDTTPATDLDGFGLVPYGLHRVRIAYNDSAGNLKVDYVWQKARYTLIEPTSGVRLWNVAGQYTYSNPTQQKNAVSTGGYRTNGYVYTNRMTATTDVTFYINGSGFLLYTAIGSGTVGPRQGEWLIYIDGVQLDYQVAGYPACGTAPCPIELGIQRVGPTFTLVDIRYTPFAFAISGLEPGMHKITLRGRVDPTENVEFTGVRVFP